MAGLLLGLLSGCAWIEFADIERQENTGTAFDRSLYDGYLALSKERFEEYDLVDQHRFADRARMAAEGKRFEPEMLSARELGGQQRGQLGDARFRLMKAMDAGIRDSAPQDAAQAQVSFDCWMQAAEESETGAAETCQAAFETALAKAEAAPMAMAEGEEMAMPPLPEAMTILFAFNSDALTGQAKATLDKAVAAWGGAKAKWLVVSGYADRTGDETYNKALSERRADATVLYLLDQGFPARNISVRSFGEEQPAVTTPDNTPENRNRRVVISFER